MENMQNFYPMIIECGINIVKVIILIVMGCIVIPWVKKSAIPWLKERQLSGTIMKFVRAAEKLAESGVIDKSAKLDYVMSLVKKLGIPADEHTRALIENAVVELDNEFSHGAQEIVDALCDERDMLEEYLFGDEDDEYDDDLEYDDEEEDIGLTD